LYFTHPALQAQETCCRKKADRRKCCRLAGTFKKYPHEKDIAFVCYSCSFLYRAGSGPMVVQSNSKGLYLTHTVHAKDNFYSIGRMYAISPKEIAAFNSIDMTAGLSVGQSVMIPLTAANFSQKGSSGTPVYYVVGEREGLYRVSSKNGNVLMATLRKWNKLADDNLKPGQKLIVGYLQAKGAENTAAVAKAETPKTEPAKAEATPGKRAGHLCRT
jgi:LysM repeat protein